MPRRRRRSTASGPAPTRMERVEQWRARLDRARQLRETWEQRFSVRRLEEAYLGRDLLRTSYAEDGDPLGVWLNHFFATIQSQVPGLLPREMSFFAQPQPGGRPFARLTGRALSGLLSTIAMQDDGHLRRAAKLALAQAFFRVGVLKCTYDPRLEPNPMAGQPMVNDLGVPLKDEQGRDVREPSEVVTDEVYRWRWVNAARMLFPDAGPDMDRWPWIGEEIEVPLEEAQADTRFPAHVRRSLRANCSMQLGEVHMQPLTEEDVHAEPMLRYVECWDLRQNRLYIWADGQDVEGFLLDTPTPDGVEDHPYAILAPVPILAPEPSPWPVPLTYNWLPLQEQYNMLRQQQLQAGQRAARKILYDQATFADPEEARKALQSARDLEAVMVQDIGRPPIVVGDGAQSIDVSRNIPFLLSDWQRITGASGTRLGDPDADTATEAVLAEQSAGVRDAEAQTMVLTWLASAGRKMLHLVRQTLTLNVWVHLKTMGDKDFREFMASPGLLAWIVGRVGEERAQDYLRLLQSQPLLQESLKERFGDLRPLEVSRSQLEFDALVQVMPSAIRPVQRAQLLQLLRILGPAALLSPTLVEAVIESFDLPQGTQIAEELLANLRQQGGLQALQGRQGGQRAPTGTANGIRRTPVAAALAGRGGQL